MPPLVLVASYLIFEGLVDVGVGLAAAETIAAVLAPSLIYGGIAMAASLVERALNKPNINQGGSTASFRAATAARRIVYGHIRVGACTTFVHLGSIFDYPNDLLVLVQTLTGHEVDAVTGTLFDGLPVTFNSSPNPQGFYEEDGSRYGGKVWQQIKIGTPCEPAFSGVIAQCVSDGSNLWTSAHRQDGCASIGLLLAFDSNIFPSGPPTMSWDVSGKKLFDLRNGTTVYSRNPVLAIYDYLTSQEYGLGADPATEINEASFIAAANICDENIPLKAGGFEDRYTCNGSFLTDADPADVLSALADCISGYISYSQGQWYVVPGVWTDPVISLNDDDMRAPMEIQTLQRKRDMFNAVQGTFAYPGQNYNQVNFPPVVHPVPLCQDSGYPNANQTGDWVVSTAYNPGDCAIEASPRQVRGIWGPGIAYVVNDYVSDTTTGDTYVCIFNHTSSIAGATGNEPGVGSTYNTYWVDVTDSFTQFRGGVFVCTTAHTSTLLDEPGIGANWATYWVEMTNYIWKDLDLNFTTSSPTAQRIANIALERIRFQTTGVLKCKLSALQLQPGDVFNLTHDRFGWADETFQVIQADLIIDAEGQSGDGPIVGVDLKVQMVSPTIYEWDPTTQEQDQGQPSQPTIPDSEIPGTTPAAYGPGFTYTSAATSIHLFWDYTGDNKIILLNQQLTEYEPSGGQGITGLTASTAYNLYPCYNIRNAVFTCLMTDGVGTPAWVEIPSVDPNVLRARTAEWQRDGNIPLALLPITITTPASGSGGGGGGGDGGCLRVGMLVKEKTRGIIPCEEVRVSDVLWSESEEGMEVSACDRRLHDLWAVLKFNNGAELIVTVLHPFTLADGSMKRAAQLSMEDAIRTPTGIAYPIGIAFSREQSEKIPITGKDSHTFYASADGKNWVLTHNIQGTQ